jgi:hypothetical protein
MEIIMTRCLDDKALFLLSEGEASEEQQSHVQTCPACMERYAEIQQDLRLITQTLEQEPPPALWAKPRSTIFYRSLPIAAGVLLAVALMWGESRLWRSEAPSEQTLNGEVSQFLEQVAEAIDGGAMKDVETASSDGDLAYLQVALGEDCSDECRRLFENAFSAHTRSNSTDRSFLTANKHAGDPAIHQMADRDE